MSDIQEYKCPCCGGAIEFNANIQKMKCPYCDTEFEMDILKQYDEELNTMQEDDMNWETSAGGSWQDEEAEGLRSYICRSCGGEIVGDANMAASKCPYCDNPVVMMEQFSGILKPDYVIPFKLDKKAAKAEFSRYLSNKKLLPNVFKSGNHVDEIKGVYVPFWLFDTDVDAKVRYRATKVRMWSDSRYDYTKTSYYAVRRSGNIGFEKVPVDGSTKMPDDLMESVEPFDFSEAVSFQTAYLAGYMADKYDVNADESIARANERVRESTQNAFRDTVNGYATVNCEASGIQLKNGVSRYALYPVWLLNTTWNGQKYVFAMNGQTGKFVGNLPVDKGKAVKIGIAAAAISSGLIYALAWLLWLVRVI